MPTWSGTRKKLEEDYLCPALRGRVRYFATTYRESHDQGMARAAILVDGTEVLKGDCVTYFRVLGERARGLDEQGLSWREVSLQAKRSVLKDGLFDPWSFYVAFQIFDNQSIESSLADEHPIVRIFALLDRRLGKRRLAALEETIEQELDWVRPFYLLRMEAEGLKLQKEKEVC